MIKFTCFNSLWLLCVFITYLLPWSAYMLNSNSWFICMVHVLFIIGYYYVCHKSSKYRVHSSFVFKDKCMSLQVIQILVCMYIWRSLFYIFEIETNIISSSLFDLVSWGLVMVHGLRGSFISMLIIKWRMMKVILQLWVMID